MNDDTRLPRNDGAEHTETQSSPFMSWLRLLLRGREDDSAWDRIQDMVEEREEPVTGEERTLLSNVLKLHDRTVSDAMVPRVDIIALEVQTPFAEVVRHMADEGHSRVPVYRETLDDVVGMVHVKDVLACMAAGKECTLAEIVRRIPVVTPGMKVLDLLRQMRQDRHHIALVVDEYGGIDGLVTLEDLVEEIVGEIEDEYDEEAASHAVIRPDGTMVADARLSVREFERKAGPVLTDVEREEVDTLGGLVFSLAGRVPRRGDILNHPSGLEFEVLEADSRRVRKVKVRNLSGHASSPPPSAGE
ncbi:MAG: hemolysin family protein [Pseudomonadota bacterium]|nr:hemolysin family protein [Pseudomonadota bacterium]